MAVRNLRDGTTGHGRLVVDRRRPAGTTALARCPRHRGGGVHQGRTEKFWIRSKKHHTSPPPQGAKAQAACVAGRQTSWV